MCIVLEKVDRFIVNHVNVLFANLEIGRRGDT